MEQPEYNIFARQRVEIEYAPVYRETGLGLTTWSPLASGILTGKYSSGAVPPGSRFAVESYSWLAKSKLEGDKWQVEAADRLAPIAADLGCSLAQLSIAWVLSNKKVSTCILGATSLAQLTENLGALDVLPKLTPEVLARIEEAAGERTVPTLAAVASQVKGIRALDSVQGLNVGRGRGAI